MTKPQDHFGAIGVVMGGCSSEREISLKSGRAVVEALQGAGCRVKAIDLADDNEQAIVKVLREASIDIAFITLHGKLGEDGKIQSILEKLGIPYTGSGVEASRTAFNKAQTQKTFKNAGLPVADFLIFKKAETVDEVKVIEALGLPLVVKPTCEGSSIGISCVERREDLKGAVDLAFQYGEEILLERFIKGKELTAGVLDGAPLPLVEIRAPKGFFDFKSKYQKGLTDYVVPAEIPEDLTGLIQQWAAKAYRTLGCDVYSRIDFRLDENNRPFILEVNTIPGFTETSLFPKAAQKAGLDFTGLCLRLIELSYGKKKKS